MPGGPFEQSSGHDSSSANPTNSTSTLEEVGDRVSQFGGFCVEGGNGEGGRAAVKRVGGMGKGGVNCC